MKSQTEFFVYPSTFTSIKFIKIILKDVVINGNGDTAFNITFPDYINYIDNMIPNVNIASKTGSWRYVSYMFSSWSSAGCILNIHNHESNNLAVTISISGFC